MIGVRDSRGERVRPLGCDETKRWAGHPSLIETDFSGGGCCPPLEDIGA